MAILEVKNIKKGFGSVDVLKGVSFSLEKGPVLAIIGSSGRGKTTGFISAWCSRILTCSPSTPCWKT